MTAHPPDAREITNKIQRVNRLGAASEQLFSRLYRGIGKQNKAAQMHEEKNRNLERALAQRDLEIERLNSILATIDEGVLMQDNEGRLVFMNNAARALLGGIKSFWQSELGTLFNNFREIVALDSEISPLSEPTRVQVNNRILGAQLAAVADEA